LDWVAVLENPFEPFFAPVHPRDLKIGSVGAVDWERPLSKKFQGAEFAVVYQIVDDTNMLVELSWSVWEARGQREEDVVQSIRNKTKLIWVRGLETNQLVERDVPVRNGGAPQHVFEVKASTTYRAAVGSNAVLLLELVDTAPFIELFTQAAEARVWTDATGKYTFEAIFVFYERNKVLLVGMDGKPKDVSMSQLSDVDQDYVRERMQEVREATSERASSR
jgi:hypothetical protein